MTKSGKVRIDRGAIQQAQRYDGKWVLQTNDDALSLEDAACRYKRLMAVEGCFRASKKTRIKMAPLYPIGRPGESKRMSRSVHWRSSLNGWSSCGASGRGAAFCRASLFLVASGKGEGSKRPASTSD